MIVAGVDVGSTTAKAVLIDENHRVLSKYLTHTGAHVVKAAERAFAGTLQAAHLEEWDVSTVVATGYGRFKVSFGHFQVTEISCHAKGAHFFFPGTRTILDIGGQDTKAIRINESGEVIDFCMNDKCAAGTGRFLEAAANVLGMDVSEIGEVSLRSTKPLAITNVCTVFVESEIMSHLVRGRRMEDILRGVHNAIAARSVALIRRVGITPEVTFTGGVSRNLGMVTALEDRLGQRINVSEDAIFLGAAGAALFALERAKGDGEVREEASETREAGTPSGACGECK